MDNEVTFADTENKVGNVRIVPSAPTGILEWLIKNKVAENGKKAEFILLVVAIISIVAAISIFIYSSIASQHTVSQSQLNFMKNEKLPPPSH